MKKYCLISIQQIVCVFRMKPKALIKQFELQDLAHDSNMNAMFRLYSLARYIEQFGPHAEKGEPFVLEQLPVIAAEHEAFIQDLNMDNLWAYSQACLHSFTQIQMKVYEEIKRGKMSLQQLQKEQVLSIFPHTMT